MYSIYAVPLHGSCPAEVRQAQLVAVKSKPHCCRQCYSTAVRQAFILTSCFLRKFICNISTRSRRRSPDDQARKSGCCIIICCCCCIIILDKFGDFGSFGVLCQGSCAGRKTCYLHNTQAAPQRGVGRLAGLRTVA